jgi:putative IMPACT (imprinted ancient) family translation regulator
MGSTFQGHAAPLAHGVSVDAVLGKLLKNRAIASADHNIYAYRTGKDRNLKEGFSDDGEPGAGKRLLEMLQNEETTNAVVVCTRWFGGVHIGPKRFDHITECAKVALSKLHLHDGLKDTANGP